MGSLSAQHPDSASDPTWAWPAKDGPWAPVGRGPVRPSPPWAEPVSRGPSSSETILLGNQLSFLQSPSSPGDLILVSALPPGLCESFIGRLRKKSRRLCLTKAFVTCTAEPADPRRAAVLSAGQRSGLALLRCGSAPGPESVLSQRVLGCLGHAHPWGHPARAGLWRLTCCSVTLVSWEDCGSVGPGFPVWVPGFHG